MSKPHSRWPTALRAGVRGLVAAMAMTGTRTLTASIGHEEKSPPEAIIRKHAPRRILRLPRRQREAVTELLHWSYGTLGGVVFGLLPERVRWHPATGPTYGLAVWLVFHAALAPMLDVERSARRPMLWPAMVAADHVLYGIVVAGRLAPEPARTGEAKPNPR
jgi:hypothetical protein